MTGIHQTNEQPPDTEHRIRKSRERVHGTQAARCQSLMSRLEPRRSAAVASDARPSETAAATPLSCAFRPCVALLFTRSITLVLPVPSLINKTHGEPGLVVAAVYDRRSALAERRCSKIRPRARVDRAEFRGAQTNESEFLRSGCWDRMHRQ